MSNDPITRAADAFRLSRDRETITLDFAAAGTDGIHSHDRVVLSLEAGRRLLLWLDEALAPHLAGLRAAAARALPPEEAAAAVRPGASPVRASPDEAAEIAGRMMRLVAGLGAPVRREHSFQLRHGTIAANRFLLTLNPARIPGVSPDRAGGHVPDRGLGNGPDRNTGSPDRGAAHGSDRTATNGADRSATAGSDRTAADGSNRTAAAGSDRTATAGSDRTAADGPNHPAADGSGPPEGSAGNDPAGRVVAHPAGHVPNGSPASHITAGGLREQAAGDAKGRVLAVCAELGMPEAARAQAAAHFNSAAALHFGFEGTPGRIVRKLYLERLTQRGGDPFELYLAFKWDGGATAVTSRYLLHPALSAAAMRARLANICGDDPIFDIAAAVVDLAASRVPVERLGFLEVTEDGTPRRSFDLNLYDAGLMVRDLQTTLYAMRTHFDIRPGQFQALYDQVRALPLGHVAGGLHRDGSAFFNIYHAPAG